VVSANSPLNLERGREEERRSGATPTINSPSSAVRDEKKGEGKEEGHDVFINRKKKGRKVRTFCSVFFLYTTTGEKEEGETRSLLNRKKKRKGKTTRPCLLLPSPPGKGGKKKKGGERGGKGRDRRSGRGGGSGLASSLLPLSREGVGKEKEKDSASTGVVGGGEKKREKKFL